MKQLLIALTVTQLQVDLCEAECKGCKDVDDPIECEQLAYIVRAAKKSDPQIVSQLKAVNKYCEGWNAYGYCRGCNSHEEDIREYQSSKEKCEARIKEIKLIKEFKESQKKQKESKETTPKISYDELANDDRICNKWVGGNTLDPPYITKPHPKEIVDVIKGVVNSKIKPIDYSKVDNLPAPNKQAFKDVDIGGVKYKIITNANDKSVVYKEIKPGQTYQQYKLWPDENSKNLGFVLVKRMITVTLDYDKDIDSIKPSDSYEILEKEKEPKGVKKYLEKVANENDARMSAVKPLVRSYSKTLDTCPKPEKQTKPEVHKPCPKHCLYTACYGIAANTLSKPTGWTPELWRQRALELQNVRGDNVVHFVKDNGFTFEFAQLMLHTVGLSFVAAQPTAAKDQLVRYQFRRGAAIEAYVEQDSKNSKILKPTKDTYKLILEEKVKYKTRDKKESVPMTGLIVAVHTNPHQSKTKGREYPAVNHATAVFKFNGHYWYIDTNEQKILHLKKDGTSPGFDRVYKGQGKHVGRFLAGITLGHGYRVDHSLDLGDATTNIDNIAKWVYKKCEKRKIVGECGALYYMVIIKDSSATIDWDVFIKKCKGNLKKYYKNECGDTTAAKMVIYDEYAYDDNDDGYDFNYNSIILTLFEVDMLMLLLVMLIFCFCVGFIASIGFKIYVDHNNNKDQRINYQHV